MLKNEKVLGVYMPIFYPWESGFFRVDSGVETAVYCGERYNEELFSYSYMKLFGGEGVGVAPWSCKHLINGT